MAPQDPFNPNQPQPQPMQPGQPFAPQPQPQPMQPQPMPVAPPPLQPDPMTQPQPQPQAPVFSPTPMDTQPAMQPMQPPAPGPQPFTPPMAPPQPIMGGAMPGMPAKNNKKAIMLAIIAVVIAILVGVGIYVYLMFFQTVKLTTYSNSNYTVQVPDGYTQEADGNAEIFTEKGDHDTASSVYTYYVAFPSTLSDSEVTTVKDDLKTQLQSAADSFASSGTKAENLKVVDSTYKGKSALELTADVTRNGTKVEHVRMIAVVTNKEAYMVGVGANTTDPGVANAANTIIDSFTLK